MGERNGATKMCLLFQIILFVISVTFIDSYKLLAVFPYFGKSHFVTFQPYLEELANRGHELVVVSHFPRDTPLKNYKDISLEGSMPIEGIDSESLIELDGRTQFRVAYNLASLGHRTCDSILALLQVQKLLNSDEKFDLFISELFNADCFLGIALKFKIPVVVWSSCPLMPWASGRIGNVDNPAFTPIMFSEFGVRMNFMERLMNALFYIVHRVRYYSLFEEDGDRILRRHLGNYLPSLAELAKNTSIIFVNTHFSVHGARSQVPGVIEVGGVHIKKDHPLPQVRKINKLKYSNCYLNTCGNATIHGAICSYFFLEKLWHSSLVLY